MPAPAAIAVMMIVVTVAVVVIVVTVAVIVSAPASTCFATEYFYHVPNFLFRSVSVFNDMAFKVQRFTCQRMVQVHLHLLFGDIDHTSPEVVAVLVLQGYRRPFEDMLMVEVVVDGKDFSVHIHNVCLFVFSVCLFYRQREAVRVFSCGRT